MIGFKQSPWIIHYDASSCNGCDIETLACLTPLFDVERLGVVNTGNPKHADIFLVTGAVNEQSREVIRNIYRQMAEPKAVVAVGACASSGGVFRECYNVSGGVDTVIPVDVYVPGCAARPEAIIDGVVQAIAVLDRKRRATAAAGGASEEPVYARAEKADAAEILALQKAAYQDELKRFGADGLPALRQTLPELEEDFESKPGHEAVVLKAMLNGKIVGSVRGHLSGDTAHVRRLAVHPYYQRRGIGRRLVVEIQRAFPGAGRIEVCAAQQSQTGVRQFQKLGFQEFKTESFSPTITWVHLQKERS